MKEKKYTLTISVLASNRKDILPQTLESIKPLLDNVSCELIVTDTGCDEELLEVVRRYTDKIIKFEWCKDFSKARNVSVEAALGEWYLFLDDDEWFEDVTEIIDFFNGEEKNKYGCAQYIQRNYHNFEGTNWSDAVVARVFKLFDGTRFKDIIHEMPINVRGPMKNFSSFVHHYGYIYKTEEAKKAHRERNLSLLLQQIEREPNIARHYIHLAQEYSIAGEYDKVIEVVNRGLDNIDMTTPDAKKNIPGLYAFEVLALERMSRYEAVLQKSLEYMDSEYCNLLCEAMLSGFYATSACKLKEYVKSINYAHRFFKLKEYFDNKPDDIYEQSTAMLMYALEDGNSANVAYAGMLSASALKQLIALEKFADCLALFHVMIADGVSECVGNIVAMICEDTDENKYVGVVQKILCNEQLKNVLLKTVMNLKKESMHKFLKMAAVIGYTDSQHGYVQYLRIIGRFNQTSIEQLKSWYKKAISSISDIIEVEHEFWVVANKCNINLQDMIEEVPLDRWMSCVEKWSLKARIKELIEKKQDLDKVLGNDCMQMKFFDMILTESLLIRKKLESISADLLREELKEYAEKIIDFYSYIYREKTLTHYITVLPGRCQAAVMLSQMCSGQLKYTEEIRNSIIKAMPLLGKIMDKYEEICV